jgi:hypothetical protein
MKWIALLCIVFAIRTSAQTSDQGGTSTPIPTATSKPNRVAIDWHYDAEQQLLTLHLVNNSGKDITAYNISITRKYADGRGGWKPNIRKHGGDARRGGQLLINEGQYSSATWQRDLRRRHRQVPAYP